MANQSPGLFIPTNFNFDTADIYEVDITSPEFKELLVRLYQNVTSIATAINQKDTGYYILQEFINAQLFFPLTTGSNSPAGALRPVYRFVVNFGALPNNTTKSVAHGLTIGSTWTFTRIYGCASDPSTKFLPIPYASASSTSNNIELNVDTTNINIITAANYSAYTTCYVVLEYIKS